MEILFKSDHCFYFIDGYIQEREILNHPIPNCSDVDLANIKHLDDAEVLYYYRDAVGLTYPVYYEYNGMILTRGIYKVYIRLYTYNLTKDYTLTNLNLIEDV